MTTSSNLDDFSVSVIIPTYNRLQFLPRALDSVLSQTFTVNEIVVVDDGSTDKTIETLKPAYKRVRFLKQPNQGVSVARNTGINAAKHNWIAFLDSDDQWVTDKIEKQIKYLSQNPDLNACQTGEKWIRNGNQVTPPRYLDKSSQGLFERSLERCIICPSSVMLNHSVFQTVGLFDPALKICEDYDFWLRLLLTEQIGLIDEPLVEKYGGHKDQLSNSTWGLDRFRIQSLEKILHNEVLNHLQKRKILTAIIEKSKILSQGFRKHGKEADALVYEQKKCGAEQKLSELSLCMIS